MFAMLLFGFVAVHVTTSSERRVCGPIAASIFALDGDWVEINDSNHRYFLYVDMQDASQSYGLVAGTENTAEFGTVPVAGCFDTRSVLLQSQGPDSLVLYRTYRVTSDTLLFELQDQRDSLILVRSQ